MTLSVITSIIKAILSFPYFLDIVIFLFLLISAAIGYARGFWRGTFRLIFVIILLLISWFFIIDSLADYVANSFFAQMGIKIKVGTDEATSMTELIQFTIKYSMQSSSNADLSIYSNEVYVNALIISICKSIAWFILVLITEFISWIFSALLYFLLIRLIIPEKIRKIRLRLLGALMGLLQGVVVTFCFMVSFANISPAFAYVNNPGKGAFSWCSNGIKVLFKAFDPNNSILVSYVVPLENSMAAKFSFVIEIDGTEVKFDLIEELNKFADTLSNLEYLSPDEVRPSEFKSFFSEQQNYIKESITNLKVK